MPALSAATTNEHVRNEVKYLRSRIFTQYRPEVNAILFDAGELEEIRSIIADDVDECIIEDIFVVPKPMKEENTSDSLGRRSTYSQGHPDSVALRGNAPVSPEEQGDQFIFGCLSSAQNVSSDHNRWIPEDNIVIRESVGMQCYLNPGQEESRPTHDCERECITNTTHTQQTASRADVIGLADGKDQRLRMRQQYDHGHNDRELPPNSGQVKGSVDTADTQNVNNDEAMNGNGNVLHVQQMADSEANSMVHWHLHDVMSGDIPFEENVSKLYRAFT